MFALKRDSFIIFYHFFSHVQEVNKLLYFSLCVYISEFVYYAVKPSSVIRFIFSIANDCSVNLSDLSKMLAKKQMKYFDVPLDHAWKV